MFLKPSTCFLFLLPLMVQFTVQARSLNIASGGYPPVSSTCDTTPFQDCTEIPPLKRLKTTGLCEPYSWLKKNRSKLDSGYMCHTLCDTCINKFPLPDGAVITLNKECECALNALSGNLAGLSGEAFLETKYYSF